MSYWEKYMESEPVEEEEYIRSLPMEKRKESNNDPEGARIIVDAFVEMKDFCEQNGLRLLDRCSVGDLLQFMEEQTGLDFS